MKLNGAEIIAECLLEQGVDTVFGYPGGAVLYIYDALYKYSDKIKHIMTAHEQGASHSADGYARSTGKTGVVIATSGPGATNLVTGIATAYMDSIPMVAITGNVSTDLLGRDSFQEVDIKNIVKPITKKSYIVMKIEDLAPTLREAFKIAQSGRKGPVLIDVPKDISSQYCEYIKEELSVYGGKNTVFENVDEALELINSSKRPIIYAGGGVISSGASEELLNFAEKIDCPVTCSVMGLGGFPASHPLYVGLIGMHGNYETNMAIDESDLIIAIGARFSDRVAGDREKFGKGSRIIHIDIDKNEIGKNVKTDVGIVGNIKDVLSTLLTKVNKKDHSEWLDQISLWKSQVANNLETSEALDACSLIKTVNKLLSADDIVVTDVGQHQMWVCQNYSFEKPRRFLTSGGLGTMGYGMGAAIGACVANPDKRVVLFTGDGSFHMNLNELVTLKSYNLPVVVFVVNNKVLGMVRQWQKLFYERRFSQTDPNRATDFSALATAFGIKGTIINSNIGLEEKIKEILDSNESWVVDCHISKDENVLPMIPPGKTTNDIIFDMK